MSRSLALLVASVLLQLPSSPSSGAEGTAEADAQMKHGQSLVEKGRLDEAVAQFQKTAEAYPAYAPAWVNLGTARYQKKQLDEAIAAFQKAIGLDPSSTIAHTNLGNAYMDAGRLDDAIAEHKKVLELDPDSTNALVNVGVALGAKGDLDGAVQYFTKAISKDPSSLLARKNLGFAYSKTKKWTAAVDELLVAQDIDASYPGVEETLQATLGEAFADFKERAKEESSDPRAHYYYAYALAYRKKLGDAIDEIDKGIGLATSKAEFFKARGLFYWKWNKPAKAEVAYRECIAQDASSWACHARLTETYTSSGKLKEAIDTASRAAEKNPTSASIQERLGVAYALDGQQEKALDAFLKAVSLGAASPILYFDIAATSFNLKSYDRSWKYARKASAMGHPRGKDLINLLSKVSQEPE